MCEWCDKAHAKGQGDYSRSGGQAKVNPIDEFFNPTYDPPNNYRSIRDAYRDGWNNAKNNPPKK